MFNSLLLECVLTNNDVIDGKLDFTNGKIILSIYPVSHKQRQKLSLQSSKINLKEFPINNYFKIIRIKDQTIKVSLKKSKIINNYSTKDSSMVYELSEVLVENNNIKGKNILNITCFEILQKTSTDCPVLKFEIGESEVSITKYNDLHIQSELFCPQQYENVVLEFLSFYFNRRICIKAKVESDATNFVTIYNTELLDSPQKIGLFEYYNETDSLSIEEYLSSIIVKTRDHKDAIRYIRSYISANNYNPVGQFLTYYSIICLFGNGYIVDKPIKGKSRDVEQYDSAIKEMRIAKDVIQGINNKIYNKLSMTEFKEIVNIPKLRNEIVHGLIAPEIEDLLYYESSINDFLRAVSFGVIYYVLTGKRGLTTEWSIYDVFEKNHR